MLRDNTGVDLHELDRESRMVILARGSDAKSAMSALPPGVEHVLELLLKNQPS